MNERYNTMQSKPGARSLLLLLPALLLAGCSHYTIAAKDLTGQLGTRESLKMAFQPAPGGVSFYFDGQYPSNGIGKILCLDPDGRKVWLIVDKNTELEITSRSTGDVTTMYFDTAYLMDGCIVGLRSRLIKALVEKVSLNDIREIRVYAEFARTEQYSETGQKIEQ